MIWNLIEIMNLGFYILIFFANIVSGYGEYFSAIGNKIELPCNTSIWGENLISLVLWYKENSGNGLPIYSIDARSTPLSKSKHTIKDQFSKRMFFDVNQNPPVLRIDPVFEQDAGEYRCRVDFKKSRTKNYIAKLQVLVPPKEVIITDSEGQKLKGKVGPFNEGIDLVLFCEAEGGQPPPNVTWWSKNTLLDDSFTLTPHNSVRNELVISNLNRNDFLMELTCKAWNSYLTVPVQSSIILELNLRPLEVKIVSNLDNLITEVRTELRCISSGSYPPVKISWWKGSEKLPNSIESLSSDKNSTQSTLYFIPQMSDNGKVLVCRAENLQMNYESLEDSKILNVKYKPQISLFLGAKIRHDSIKEGNDIYFECKVKANPPITAISWNFENQSLMSDSRKGVIISNQSLVLQKVKRNQSGRYICSASNMAGTGYSEEFFLKINYSPICKTGQKILYGVAQNEIVHISCEVDAEPSDVTFKWFLNTSTENVEIRSFISNRSQSIATYVPRNRFSYGTLLCSAQNEIGIQKDPCIFNIIPTGPPEAVRNCKISEQSATSLMVECTPGDTGGLEQEFFIEIYNSMIQRLHSNYSSRNQPKFQIFNLPPGTPFTIVLYSSNSKGRSHSVSLTTATLGEPEKHTGNVPQFGFNPILGVLIGIVGALVFIAIMIVIVIRVRADNYENDRNVNKDLQCDQSSRSKVICKNSELKNQIDDQCFKNSLKMNSQTDLSGLNEYGCGGYDRVTIYLNQDGHPQSICNQNCQDCSHHHYCYFPSVAYKEEFLPEVTYTDLQIAQMTKSQMNQMLLRNIGESKNQIEYAAINFEEINKNSRKELPNRGLQIADGCSDIEVSNEVPLNKKTLRR